MGESVRWLVASIGPDCSDLLGKKIPSPAISSLGLSVVCKRETGEQPLLVAGEAVRN